MVHSRHGPFSYGPLLILTRPHASSSGPTTTQSLWWHEAEAGSEDWSLWWHEAEEGSEDWSLWWHEAEEGSEDWSPFKPSLLTTISRSLGSMNLLRGSYHCTYLEQHELVKGVVPLHLPWAAWTCWGGCTTAPTLSSMNLLRGSYHCMRKTLLGMAPHRYL